jgi:hypothetical protein
MPDTLLVRGRHSAGSWTRTASRGLLLSAGPCNLSILATPVTRALVRAGRLRCAEFTCETELAPGDPVWWGQLRHPRPWQVYEDGFYIVRSRTGGRCRACALTEYDPSVWLPPKPCEACDRPVFYPRRGVGWARRQGRPRTRVLCSERCEWRFYRRRRSAAWAELHRKRCEACGGAFDPTRRDAVTCSPACRQKAYRQRRASGGLS